MTWLIADTSQSSYIYQLTDNYTIWEFTQYSKFSQKIREGLHARILRLKSDVQRLAENPCTSCYLIETVYRVV